MNNSIVLACHGLSKIFVDGPHRVAVLRDLDFSLQAGETVAILGVSGAGKSTLLHLLGGLDQPSAGEVLVMNQPMQQMNEKERCAFRNRHLGFIYQFHHLLPEFTVLENVCMPLLIRGIEPQLAQSRAERLLAAVGLMERALHKPSELSGGERQRTAIIRALIHQPRCVLADEPTGNLDPQTAEKVYSTMLQLNRDLATSVVIVTHDLNLAKRMDRILYLKDGQLVSSV